MKKLLSIFLLVSILTACIGEDFIEREPLFPERLEIQSNNSVATDTLFVGDSLELGVSYRNAQGVYEEVVASWSSSNPELAAITADSKYLSGLKKGVITLRANYTTLVAERLIVVLEVERVELSVNRPTVAVGDSLLLSANYFNKGPQQNPMFTYSVSNSALAEIRGNQLIAKQVGKVEVVARANGVDSDPVSVSIVSDTTSAATVDVSSSTLSIMKGDSLQFIATVKNINGTVLQNGQISWTSSDGNVLQIDNNGLAVGLELGSSDVTASVGNAQSGPSSVLVNPVVITSRTGVFKGIGSYSVAGSVTMSRKPNGSLKLDFSNFSVSSGPGLYIYLGNSTTSGISIEELNNRSGSFTVDLPSNIEITDYNNVLIWCQPFGVAFGAAVLN